MLRLSIKRRKPDATAQYTRIVFDEYGLEKEVLSQFSNASTANAGGVTDKDPIFVYKIDFRVATECLYV